MKLKNLLVVLLLLTFSVRLLTIPVSAQNQITFAYYDFNSKEKFSWRPTDDGYHDSWQVTIYNYLTYNSSYVGVYGAEVGFYNRSQRKAGTVGVTLSFTKVGKVDVMWWNGSGEASVIGGGEWTFNGPIVVTVRNGYLNVGNATNTQSIVNDFLCGTWVMRHVGAKGDVGLAIAGYVSVSIHLFKPGVLNLDSEFQHPKEDIYFYDPVVVTEYGGEVEDYKEREFPNGTWDVLFETGKATINFDHNGTDFAHVHFGAFWPKLGWSHPGKLTNDYEVEVRIKFRIVNFTDGPWLRAGVAFAMQVNLVSENPFVPGDSKFVELDFFRGKYTILLWNPNVHLVDLYQAKPGDFYSLSFPLTRYVSEFVEKGYVEADYYAWGVYIAIESIRSQMSLEVYEFSAHYWSKEPEDYIDLVDLYENLKAELEFANKLTYISLSIAVISVVTAVYFVKRKRR